MLLLPQVDKALAADDITGARGAARAAPTEDLRIAVQGCVARQSGRTAGEFETASRAALLAAVDDALPHLTARAGELYRRLWALQERAADIRHRRRTLAAVQAGRMPATAIISLLPPEAEARRLAAVAAAFERDVSVWQAEADAAFRGAEPKFDAHGQGVLL